MTVRWSRHVSSLLLESKNEIQYLTYGDNMKKKEILIKENQAFRLKVKQWKAIAPEDFNTVEFVQECIGKDGEVDFTSTYQFFMTTDELIKLADSLKELTNE